MSTGGRLEKIAASAALAGAGTLWGLGFPLGKVALRELPPATIVFYRFALASALLMPMALRAQPAPARRDWLLFLLTALLTVPLTFTLQFVGLQYTSAASAALIMGMATPMLAVSAVFLDGESLSPGGWAAVLLSTLGVALVASRPSEHGLLGDGLVLLSAASAVAGILLTKKLLRRYSALTVTAWTIFIGAAGQLPLAVLSEGWLTIPRTGPVWAALLAMGFGCSALTYILYNWGLARVGAANASVYLNLEPVVGALVGVSFLHERLSAGGVLGGILVVAAAAYVSLPGTSSKQVRPQGASFLRKPRLPG
jgi:drug/metabolite transporter (DMT)-like permease